jgi:hypothetical protein
VESAAKLRWSALDALARIGRSAAADKPESEDCWPRASQISTINPELMEAFVRAHHVIGLVAALAIAIGAKQYLFPPIKASQIKVAQSNLGLVIALPDNGNSDRTEVASVKTLLRPVFDAESVERANDQSLMATGLDLNGPPKRFSTKEILGNLEIPGF